jgi:hypothetical protein
LARGQARDLFDCHQILTVQGIDPEYLHIAFVVYCMMNRKDSDRVAGICTNDIYSYAPIDGFVKFLGFQLISYSTFEK